MDRLERVMLISNTDIPSNEMNNQLKELYRENWGRYETIRRRFTSKGYEIADIYIVTVPDEYVDAKSRIMLLGKETQSWGSEFQYVEPGFDDLQRLYALYVYEERGNKAPFMNFMNWLDSLSDDISIIPNNIVKVGKKNGSGYYIPVATALNNEMNLLKDEIAITSPSLIVCPTSNIDKYNECLRKLLGTYTEQTLSEEPFMSLRYYESFPNIPLIMCPHPQGKTREELSVIKTVIANLLKEFNI